MKIKITVDSTVDLPKKFINENNIKVFPIIIMLDDRECLDGVNITTEDIFAFVKATNILPKTAANNIQTYTEEFQNILKSGYDAIIHFALSSGISSTCKNAQLAASELKNVFVIDTQSLSTGMGIQVLECIDLVNKGLEAKEIVQKIEEKKNKVQASFVLDQIKFLHKGGRCSTIALLGANIFKIKPCIEVVNGKMVMTRKYRGNLDMVLKQYVTETLKLKEPDGNKIFIAHSKMDEKYVKLVKDILKNEYNFKEIIEADAGPTIVSHCGENTLGIMYYTK